MAEKFILTEEQRKIMNENGLDRINVWNRVKKLGWSIEKAITVPVRKANNEKVVGIERHENDGIYIKLENGNIIHFNSAVPSKIEYEGENQ
ncbi:TPA: hypothetical protein I1848_002585 [Staphylococcus pseudintermedius]|uniref:hypothetical protein n=1 Tax=Staphylococcus pseudintermedius TaxID=283734 RepID=UPI001BDE8B9C|nr:hypothetical protein [Staphylococcus pseudintermedius]MDK3898284.1 hypothetical protein [Staphylococcus pseudintermedius]HAR6525748.1 hypothetical protein [Staphylococcus pseudintermedius]